MKFKRILTALILGCLIGCATPLATSNHIEQGFGGIATDVDQAQSSIIRAMPFTAAQGKGNLQSASANLADAHKQLITTEAAETKLEKDDSDTHTELSAEQSHWIGYKTRILSRWIIGISVALWLTIGVLFVINSMSPIAFAGPVIVEIANALPFFNPFMWIETYLKAKKAKAAATPAEVVK